MEIGLQNVTGRKTPKYSLNDRHTSIRKRWISTCKDYANESSYPIIIGIRTLHCNIHCLNLCNCYCQRNWRKWINATVWTCLTPICTNVSLSHYIALMVPLHFRLTHIYHPIALAVGANQPTMLQNGKLQSRVQVTDKFSIETGEFSDSIVRLPIYRYMLHSSPARPSLIVQISLQSATEPER